MTAEEIEASPYGWWRKEVAEWFSTARKNITPDAMAERLKEGLENTEFTDEQREILEAEIADLEGVENWSDLAVPVLPAETAEIAKDDGPGETGELF